METQLRTNLIQIISVIVIGLLLVGIVNSEKKAALREANYQATIRELSSFHKDYLAKEGIRRENYLRELKARALEHPNLQAYLEQLENGNS
jgi:hypothetical protein